MSNTNTGGPAFPVLIVDRPKELAHFNGMTLRDYFAAKAIQGMFASGNLPKSVQDDELASVAYEFADAMLKAREA
jgi:hypothetical protein